MTKIECTECEWIGTENDLHYKKAKQWATSEDPVCPNCGGPVIYETPLPERVPGKSEITIAYICDVLRRALIGNKDVRVEFENEGDNANFILDVCNNFRIELKKDNLNIDLSQMTNDIKNAIDFITHNPEREMFLEDCQQKDIENNVMNLEQAEEINWEHWDNQYHLVLKFLKSITVRQN